jgi:hypothetical protein
MVERFFFYYFVFFNQVLGFLASKLVFEVKKSFFMRKCLKLGFWIKNSITQLFGHLCGGQKLRLCALLSRKTGFFSTLLLS